MFERKNNLFKGCISEIEQFWRKVYREFFVYTCICICIKSTFICKLKLTFEITQACIDDNLEMVEFLVENGADVNRGDNEGWTPLHATASCGFLSIAKYLIEHGADVAAVNNDGQLAIDVTDHNNMEDFLKAVIKERGIDCDAARNEEETMMLKDAKEWLAKKMSDYDKPHPKTGATPLHVAAAKGYAEVIK